MLDRSKKKIAFVTGAQNGRKITCIQRTLKLHITKKKKTKENCGITRFELEKPRQRPLNKRWKKNGEMEKILSKKNENASQGERA